MQLSVRKNPRTLREMENNNCPIDLLVLGNINWTLEFLLRSYAGGKRACETPSVGTRVLL